MKVIIAGSRNARYARDLVSDAAYKSGFEITEVVSGNSGTIDLAAEQWGEFHGIKVTRFPADWERFGRAAGPKRNKEMAEYADALIAVWDGVSRGTRHMIREGKQRGMPVYVHNYEPPSPAKE